MNIDLCLRKFVIIGAALAIAGCTEASSPGTLPDLKHDPILFVHGYLGSKENWEIMKQRFIADGWQDFELYAYNFSFVTSNATTAGEIRDSVNAIIRKTGATKVDRFVRW